MPGVVTSHVRRGDFGQLDLGRASFDLVVAQMQLLHVPNPAEACQRCVALTAPGGQIVIHDADFGPLTFADASASEAAGLAVMSGPSARRSSKSRHDQAMI